MAPEIVVPETMAAPGFEAEMHLLGADMRDGRSMVWISLGKKQNAAKGDKFEIYDVGAHIGAIELDYVLYMTSSGKLILSPGRGIPAMDRMYTFIPQPGSAAAAAEMFVPDAAIFVPPPGGGRRITNNGWRPEWDKALNMNFRAWAEIPATLPPAPATPAQTATSTLPDVTVDDMDPEMADDINSSFFIEPGDCVFVKPWSGLPDGGGLIVTEADTLIFPDGFTMDTEGKTLIALEKNLNDHLKTAKPGVTVKVQPCRKKY